LCIENNNLRNGEKWGVPKFKIYIILNYNKKTKKLFGGKLLFYVWIYPISSKFVLQTFIKNEYYGYTQDFIFILVITSYEESWITLPSSLTYKPTLYRK